VRLPLALDHDSAETTDIGPSGQAVTRPLRILIVDDNRDNANCLRMVLDLAGHDTRTSYDGLEAIEAAEAFRPQVILLDIGMPKLNGYEVCSRIRNEAWGAGMVLIAQTGWGQDEDRRRTRAAGFDHHLVKPVNHEALMEILAECSAAAPTK
jgi:CheY-like chemotaxis protein